MIINIPLSKAYELLEKASAIILSNEPGNPLIYPDISGLTGEADNQFLSIYYLGDNAYEFCFSFIEENNLTAQIDTMTNELILIDDTNEKVRLSLLTTMKL